MTATDPGQKSEQRQRTRLVGVRLLPAEHERLRWAAGQRGVSVSSLLRDSALSAIFCGATHPLDDTTLCRVLASECRADEGIGLHSWDGANAWTTEPEPTEETS